MRRPAGAALFMMLYFKNILAALLLPPLGPLVLVALGLLLLGRRPRLGRIVAWSGLAVGVAMITPATVGKLIDGLEDIPVVDPVRLADAGAIVILSGGLRDYAPEYGGPTVNRVTLERVRYGARLARQSGLPVLVSGGTPSRQAGALGPGEAQLMKRVLEEDFRVPVRWVEGRSLDTRQNADFSAPMLREAGVGKVVLVTHAAHMHRAMEAFEQAGIAVIPAPTAFLGGRGRNDNLLPSLPAINSAYAGGYAAHEWAGILAYRLSR